MAQRLTHCPVSPCLSLSTSSGRETASPQLLPLHLQRELLSLMPDFPVVPIWFKAWVPRHKASRQEVKTFVEHIRREFDPPPWDLPGAADP